ncbi:IS3 family transposase [Spiroplasma chrysopicola]|uniref:IS3 family transposase n=1 Tax=Spiroplasma chrysopicola TaxID=216933 RepID=UPI002E823243|nr:IS3 family transposase [Spiroplasma chrysopicola]
MKNYAIILELRFQCPDVETLMRIIENLPKYIYFYNNFRPQAKLKGMSPVQYRKSFLQVTF